jgi:hypothetical protein
MFNSYYSQNYYGKRESCETCGYMTDMFDTVALNRHIVHTINESSRVMEKLMAGEKRRQKAHRAINGVVR